MSVIDRTGWKENVQDLINLIQLLVAISVKALWDILKFQAGIPFKGPIFSNYAQKAYYQWFNEL